MNLRLARWTSLLLLLPWRLSAAAPSPEQVEFFERKIRPILAQECYECHSTAGKKKGGLLLDSRAGWQAGGDSGEVIVPGHAEKSLLITSIHQTDPDLKMPSKGPKLEGQVIRDFEQWVNMGAPDPREHPSTAEEVAQDKDWSSVFRRRTAWWSFQPITHPKPPLAGDEWSEHPIDRFLAKAMADGGLKPAADADPAVILRRLTFVLTGLPPTPEENAEFLAAARQDLPTAIGAAADRLLASPRFGEAWARHWMDWVRFAETHGSEGDPAIPFAWRFRDYLIRAFNDDVPFPQLVREHIAGDLLDLPRVNAAQGINESALGAAHFRMVLHGFTPTDAYDEQATFTDNQIDTVTKAFLGMTVACARCHNHKFDAISQADYYALFGIFASCRPATVDVNLPDRQKAGAAALAAQKQEIRARLAQAWLARLDELPKRLHDWAPEEPQPQKDEKGKPKKVPAPDSGPLADWLEMKKLPAEKWPGAWERLRKLAQENAASLERFRAQPTAHVWDLRGRDFSEWQSDGLGVRQGPSAAGAFQVVPEGDRVIGGIYPAGTYSHLLSDRTRAVLASPPFTSEGGKIWARVRGSGDARARYVVRNYPRSGTVYQKSDLNSDVDQWVSWDLTYWKGDKLHLEITTDEDQPIETKMHERSSFGVSEVRYVADPNGFGPPPTTLRLLTLCARDEAAPADEAALAGIFVRLARESVEHWRDGKLTDQEAEFLGHLARQNLLPNKLAELPEVAPLIARYRADEAALPLPTRAPGLLEGFAFDQALFTRGDHKKPAEIVPRRFLEAIDPRPYQAGETESGRRQLAESLVAPSNPLTPRVIVNRLWLHVFGQGLVTSPDNFGRLGEAPSHPELLDYLATAFQAQGGSMKSFLRALVTTRAFRLDHRAPAGAAESDPQNRLLSHFPARRLEAEAIRDTMLALTGKLEKTVGGESVGPGAYRRSVYEKIVRNNLDPLLTAFDFPVPSATRGKRDATNVPAQALALLNDPAVSRWASDWARRIARDEHLANDTARVQRMFAEAFNRPAGPAELERTLGFLRATVMEPAREQELRQEIDKQKRAREETTAGPSEAAPGAVTATPEEQRLALEEIDKKIQAARTELEEGLDKDAPWRALAQALFNTKEFIYLQ